MLQTIACNKIPVDFPDLIKDAKSVAGFSLPAYFESDRLTSDKHSLAVKTVSIW